MLNTDKSCKKRELELAYRIEFHSTHSLNMDKSCKKHELGCTSALVQVRVGLKTSENELALLGRLVSLRSTCRVFLLCAMSLQTWSMCKSERELRQ